MVQKPAPIIDVLGDRLIPLARILNGYQREVRGV